MPAHDFWLPLFVIVSLALYVVMAMASRATSPLGFYAAGHEIGAGSTGAGVAAAAVAAGGYFALAGAFAELGPGAQPYLWGFVGGLAFLFVTGPAARGSGALTLAEHIGAASGSGLARALAAVSALAVAMALLVAQIGAAATTFARFFDAPMVVGASVAAFVAAAPAVRGGMRGVSATQIAQYWILAFAFIAPAVFVSLIVTGAPAPWLPSATGAEGGGLAARLDQTLAELGFAGGAVEARPPLDAILIGVTLAAGLAGAPHLAGRFVASRSVAGARVAAIWALALGALVCAAAPGAGVLARHVFADAVDGVVYDPHDASVEDRVAPDWLAPWRERGLIAWTDHNGDGRVDYVGPANARGQSGAATPAEVAIAPDVMVIASGPATGLPDWATALAVVGALAAALSTAAGAVIVVAGAVARDIAAAGLPGAFDDARGIVLARIAAVGAVVVAAAAAARAPVDPAQALGMAAVMSAATLFPAVVLSAVWRGVTPLGAVLGLIAGAAAALGWLALVGGPIEGLAPAAQAWWRLSPVGAGAAGLVAHFAVATGVSFAAYAARR